MSKLISISDDVYKNLKHMKGKESYSSLLREMIETEAKTNKEKILSFFGVGGIDEEKIRGLKRVWKEWSEKYV